MTMINAPEHKTQIQPSQGDGIHWCMHFASNIQTARHDLADKHLLAEDFPTCNLSLMALGDNILINLIDHWLHELSLCAVADIVDSNIFAKQVANLQCYRVPDFGKNGSIYAITVKSDVSLIYAVQELNCLFGTVPNTATRVTSTKLGDREIQSPLGVNYDQVTLQKEHTVSESAWIETGAYKTLHYEGTCLQKLNKGNGTQVGSSKKTVINKNCAKKDKCRESYFKLKKYANGVYLHTIPKENS